MPAPTDTPADAGFRMPPEWTRHARTWMVWPARDALWHGRIEAARLAYAAVARAIARFEPVSMLANEAHVAAAEAACGPGIEILPCPVDDSWARDIGPSFLVDGAGHLGGADWRFNAWGGKWPDYGHDAEVARFILERAGARRFAAPFVLEGGSVHVDGMGTILTSEQCLLHPNRNPGLGRGEIEANLKAWLGGSTIIWLGQGLENDDTDGHVDNLACFARPGVVLASVCRDPQDANHAPLSDNLARLRAARDAAGRALEIVELPLPAPRVTEAGRLGCNYVNFYFANGAVITPAFGDPMDQVALDTFRRVFPDREVVQVPVTDVLQGGGGIHCITQQQPAAKG